MNVDMRGADSHRTHYTVNMSQLETRLFCNNAREDRNRLGDVGYVGVGAGERSEHVAPSKQKQCEINSILPVIDSENSFFVPVQDK